MYLFLLDSSWTFYLYSTESQHQSAQSALYCKVDPTIIPDPHASPAPCCRFPNGAFTRAYMLYADWQSTVWVKGQGWGPSDGCVWGDHLLHQAVEIGLRSCDRYDLCPAACQSQSCGPTNPWDTRIHKHKDWLQSGHTHTHIPHMS